MEKTIKTNCLRYLIPFSVNGSFESACRKMNDFQGNITPRYVIDDAERVYSWKQIASESNETGRQKESDLYEYIRNEFSMSETVDDENKMGCAWKLTCENWKDYGKQEIPYEFYWFMTSFKKNDQKLPAYHQFSFSEIGLYLFRNGLGILWYEVKFNGKLQAEELISFQNIFRELNRNSSVWVKTGKSSPVYMKYSTYKGDSDKDPDTFAKYLTPFCVGNWISELLSKFLNVSYISPRANSFVKNVKEQLKRTCGFGEITSDHEEFLNHETVPNKVPDKAILFTYIAFEPQMYGNECMISDEKRDLVYHLTNGYKESYHYSSETGNRMVQPFADALWYATKEGTSYVVWPSTSSETGRKDGNAEFFIGNFIDKIKGDYFHLFVRALYQSYSLLMYAEQTQKCLSAIKSIYMENEKNDSEQIRRQKEKNKKELENLYIDINLFLTKNMATSVSHIHHQSDFYIYLIDCLHVQEDIKSVTAGLSALDSLQRDQKEKEEHRREKEADEMEARRDNRFQAIMSMLSVLAVISVFADLRDILNPTKDFVQIAASLVGTDVIYSIGCIFSLIIGVIALYLSIKYFIKSFKE